ncbi:MAG TPA: heavy metal sensor histidine kinase [Terriglobales bacterium]|jgi:heavy metal sensor kinase|nr:heavy metal sensor histidine kinase [Terriglobales bacterium]
MKRLPIGLRLTLSYLLVFAAAQFLFGFCMWFLLRHSLYEIADEELTNQVDDLQHFLQAQKQNASIAKLQEEVTEAYVLEHSGDYLQIYAPPTDWIYRASFMEKMLFPMPASDRLAQPVYENQELGGKPFRFLSQSIAVHGRRFTVQTGIPMDDVSQTLALFRRYLVMFAPLILLAASLVGYWVSAKALSPVDTLTRTARTISGSNLSRRLEPLHTGDELQRLSDTLNEMLSRIETAFLRVTQFTADASHELRTPISLIRTEAEIALRRSRTEEEYRNALFHILMEAETTTSMVEKLLSLARADSGGEVVKIQCVDLREAVLRVAAEWRAVADSKNLGFTENVIGGEVHVAGDNTALHQLLNILLDNAVKYTPGPGRISLSLEERGDKAVLKVVDSGIGIAPADQARIFERFYRTDKARSQELGGVGLGLAIALWIVQQHHGSIAVESTPGKGSAFVVELPLQRGANPGALARLVPSGADVERRLSE